MTRSALQGTRFQPADSSWSEFAQRPGMRAVIDPNDVSGRRNAWIHATQRLALERFANITPDHQVVDWGCGNGRMTRELAHLARSVHGVDLTPEMLEQARSVKSPPNVEFHHTDGTTIPLSTGSVDVVVSVCVLQYCVRDLETYRTVLAEMCRVLRPGGRCVFIEQISPLGDVGSSSVEHPATVADYLKWGELPLTLRRNHPVRLGAPRRVERFAMRAGAWARDLAAASILSRTHRTELEELADQPYVDWLFELEHAA